MNSFRDALVALKPLLDQLTAGVQFVDDEMRYQYLNPAAAKHGRTTPEALIGRTMSECYPGIETTEVYDLIRRVGASTQSEALENVFTFPDGSQGWFELRLYKVPGGVIVMSIDITDRKNLELHVRHADRMQAAGKLAGGIAHDFNNMLMIISSVAELSIDDASLPTSHRSKLGDVLEAAQRASQLTRKLLALSSQFPGGPAEVVQLKDFIASRTSTLQAILGPRTRLVIDVPKEAGHVLIDPGALEQMLVHLAQNSHDAMGDTGTLRIEASLARDLPADARSGAPRLARRTYVSLRVIDDGPGIATDVIDRIFDPFYSTKAGDSRGLGLAMCWGLVEQAGGTIQVRSSLGRGATFEVFLPLEVIENPEPVALAPVARSVREHGARVLVVDDEAGVRRLVCALLERLGHVAVGVSNGLAALVEFSKGTPLDVVITDLVMPEMTGLDLIRHIRKSGYDTPVLVMSGYAPDHRDLRSVPRGCMLSKPFSATELKAAVDMMMQADAPRIEL